MSVSEPSKVLPRISNFFKFFKISDFNQITSRFNQFIYWLRLIVCPRSIRPIRVNMSLAIDVVASGTFNKRLHLNLRLRLQTYQTRLHERQAHNRQARRLLAISISVGVQFTQIAYQSEISTAPLPSLITLTPGRLSLYSEAPRSSHNNSILSRSQNKSLTCTSRYISRPVLHALI